MSSHSRPAGCHVCYGRTPALSPRLGEAVLDAVERLTDERGNSRVGRPLFAGTLICGRNARALRNERAQRSRHRRRVSPPVRWKSRAC